jgi:hypothetical protein
VLASHPQNLIVNTISAPLYRIVWWLAVALFVFPEHHYRTKPRLSWLQKASFGCGECRAIRQNLKLPISSRRCEDEDSVKSSPLNDISSLSDECAAWLRTRIDGVN